MRGSSSAATGVRRRTLRPLRRLGSSPSSAAPIPEGLAARASLRRDTLYRRSLGVADAIAAAGALFLGVAVIGHDRLTAAALLAVPLVVLASKLGGLYDRDQHLLKKTTLDEAPAIFQVTALYTLLLWLFEGFLLDGRLGQHQALAVWAFLTAFMLAARVLARATARRFSSLERCLVVGEPGAAEQLQRKFDDSLSVKAALVGRIPVRADDCAGGEVPCLGDLETLGLVLIEEEIDRVVIAPDSLDSDEVLEAIRIVKALGVKASVLPRLFEAVGSSVELDDVHGLTLLGVRRHGLTKSSRFLKRGLDVAGAASILALLLPLMLLIAAAIKVTSPGSVLFRQRRIGREGAVFELLKFRTMVDGADAQKARLRSLNETEGFFKMADDPRVTRIGRFLRRSSLDELPQLINVLKGDMSLVGPRPLVLDEDLRIEGWPRSRADLPPGMTGPWQILGSSRIPMHEMVKIDYLYGANWSLWLDVKILLRTVPHVLARRGL